MRVIAGKYKSRQLKTIASKNTRPTTDKNKENLFNVIGPYFDYKNALDLFAGSGALGIEALSRGAKYAYLVDKSYQAIQKVKENITSLKIENASVIKADYKKALQLFEENQIIFDLIFLDPPYKLKINKDIILTMMEKGLLQENALIIVEDTKGEEIELPESFEYKKHLVYGITSIQIFTYGGHI